MPVINKTTLEIELNKLRKKYCGLISSDYLNGFLKCYSTLVDNNILDWYSALGYRDVVINTTIKYKNKIKTFDMRKI